MFLIAHEECIKSRKVAVAVVAKAFNIVLHAAEKMEVGIIVCNKVVILHGLVSHSLLIIQFFFPGTEMYLPNEACHTRCVQTEGNEKSSRKGPPRGPLWNAPEPVFPSYWPVCPSPPS